MKQIVKTKTQSPGMAIGRCVPPEHYDGRDTLTGRRFRCFTAAKGHSYPLYYFTPAITADGRYMVIHRIMDGWLNLWRLDLRDGHMIQLTAGTTPDSGWAIWGERDVSGIYDHLSALNRMSGEAWYFNGTGLFAVHIESLQQRQVADLGDRICISQNDFSPDGSCFIYAHADRRIYGAAVERHSWSSHQEWRRTLPVIVTAVDTLTGKQRDVAELSFHIHHIVFIDNTSLLLNHTARGMGMWRIGLDGRDLGVMRPPDEHGATCHQSVTANGIWYETINWNSTPRTWVGRFEPESGSWREFAVPQDGYVHIGHDPSGEIVFYEFAGATHDLVRVHSPFEDNARRFENLISLEPYPPHTGGQRYHAHPFLDHDGKQVYHTRVVEGVCQVAAVALNE